MEHLPLETSFLLFLYLLSIEQGIKHSEQKAFYDGSCPIDVAREEGINEYIDRTKQDWIYEKKRDGFCVDHF